MSDRSAQSSVSALRNGMDQLYGQEPSDLAILEGMLCTNTASLPGSDADVKGKLKSAVEVIVGSGSQHGCFDS